MMHRHFGADAAKGTWEYSTGDLKKKKKTGKEGKIGKEGKKKEAQKGRWRAAANARERFGRLSKTFIIFDVNYQAP